MKWIELVKKIFCKKPEDLPVWAHGLECRVCKETFIDAKAHYKAVYSRGTLDKHIGKVPVLRR